MSFPFYDEQQRQYYWIHGFGLYFPGYYTIQEGYLYRWQQAQLIPIEKTQFSDITTFVSFHYNNWKASHRSYDPRNAPELPPTPTHQ
jgi:hypothetical protein